MLDLHRSLPSLGSALVALAALSLSPPAAGAASLSDNLANASAGTEVASGTRWLTASFGAGAADDTLSAVTLLLANPIPGEARVHLYSDGNLEPGSLLGTLVSPASTPTALAP